MAYIPYIRDEEASSPLRELYDRFRDSNGQLDHILRIHGPNPASLTAHYELYETLMRGRSELTRVQREMIAVVVSAINNCHY
jgi:alkylhydroperoxidase family enzyme